MKMHLIVGEGDLNPRCPHWEISVGVEWAIRLLASGDMFIFYDKHFHFFFLLYFLLQRNFKGCCKCKINCYLEHLWFTIESGSPGGDSTIEGDIVQAYRKATIFNF